MAKLWALPSGLGQVAIDAEYYTEDGFRVVPPKTDAFLFIGPGAVQPIGGTWTHTRIADGDFVWRKTAAADTSYITFQLSPYFRTTASKGVRIKSFDFVYSIGTAALTSQTPLVRSVTYANNAAVTVAAFGGTLTGTLATATQVNPYVTNISLGTQSFPVTALVDIRVQVAIVAALTSAYDWYGCFVNYDFNTT